MEVYILDSLYRRSAIVDRFESFIWAERWTDIGDFQLLISSTPVNRAIFTPETAVTQNQSKRVMIVETIEDVTDTEGRTRLKVKGRSLEKILEDRAALAGATNTTINPKWAIAGQPKAIAEYMFKRICIDGALSAKDVITRYAPGNSFPVDNIPADAEEILWEQDPASLYEAIKGLCELYGLGFRLYRNGETGQVFFNIYTGSNRTTQQKILPPVVFSLGLETVHNTTRLATVEKAKNVAYVLNEQGFQEVYAKGADPNAAGFERNVLVVKPPKLMMDGPDDTQVEPTAAQVAAYLILQGKYELAKHRKLMAFDGEVTRQTPYRYGVDYHLGDLVEMRDSDGTANIMRVTEQIFVHDEEGERSYPTLTIDSFVISGTWDSWLGNREWASFGATEYWNTQP